MKTKEIAEFLSAELAGDPAIDITSVASLGMAVAGDISFFSTPGEFVSGASAVIVPDSYDLASSCVLIKVTNPKLAFTRISRLLNPPQLMKGRHETASVSSKSKVRAAFIGSYVSIDDGSVIDEAAIVHTGVRIGKDVSIGTGTIIHPNCTIYNGVKIGSACVIHAGTVLGSDGFGYVQDESGEHLQFPQIGSLVIENNVEIGANCCIDRGSLGETRIGEGTKIDNMVHIAHNVQIGKRVLIAGQSGIAGSSVIEDDVVIAGQVGISDHVTIRSGAIIGAKSAVFPNKIVRAGFWSGIPVQPKDEYKKQISRLRNIEKLSDDIKKLKKLR